MNFHACPFENFENLGFKGTPNNIYHKFKDGIGYDDIDFIQSQKSSNSSYSGNKIIPVDRHTTGKVYTRKGDLGWCNLLSGERIMKDNKQIEACGDVDELNAVLGVFLNALPANASCIAIEIERIQKSLFQVGALIASDPHSPSSSRLKQVTKEQIRRLEQSIDSMEEKLPAVKNFVIPGGHITACQANLARSVCRRAERHVVFSLKKHNLEELPESMKNVLAYLNRLSDYLFVLSRYCNFLFYPVEQKDTYDEFYYRREVEPHKIEGCDLSCREGSEQASCL